jgi:hypothetical protein
MIKGEGKSERYRIGYSPEAWLGWTRRVYVAIRTASA